MVHVYRGVMQTTQDYINNCAAANAYSSASYPREYTRQRQEMPRYDRYPADTRRSAPYPSERPRRDSLRRAPPPEMMSRYPKEEMPPPPRYQTRSNARDSYGSSSTAYTPPSPPPPTSRPRRKSVRFDDAAKTQNPVTQRPKTFATDAPPVAISESAKETSRRLFHRRPSDGGRPSARGSVARSESTHTLNTTRAEMGTTVGREREERDRRSKGRRR